MRGDRFVLDTNALIRAALSADSPPAKVTLGAVPHGRLIFSEQTFEEFRSRLWRPKFDRYHSIERRNQILYDFSAIAEWVEIGNITITKHSRESNDDMFIATAISRSARWLVSSDKDLLDTNPPEDISILSPGDMWQKISA